MLYNDRRAANGSVSVLAELVGPRELRPGRARPERLEIGQDLLQLLVAPGQREGQRIQREVEIPILPIGLDVRGELDDGFAGQGVVEHGGGVVGNQKISRAEQLHHIRVLGGVQDRLSVIGKQIGGLGRNVRVQTDQDRPFALKVFGCLAANQLGVQSVGVRIMIPAEGWRIEGKLAILRQAEGLADLGADGSAVLIENVVARCAGVQDRAVIPEFLAV